jgi:hypothetical protein
LELPPPWHEGVDDEPRCERIGDNEWQVIATNFGRMPFQFYYQVLPVPRTG